MSFWLRLLRALGFRARAEKIYRLDDELVQSLQMLAEQERRNESELAADLINDALSRRAALQDLTRRWHSLTAREQLITWMLCHEYTAGDIAAKLVISSNTVKSHIRKILLKFNVHSRNELRLLLEDFDFGDDPEV